jgi:hypothetical protein
VANGGGGGGGGALTGQRMYVCMYVCTPSSSGAKPILLFFSLFFSYFVRKIS